MSKVAIYGAGAFGKIFYESLKGKVDFFIDDFCENSHYLNLPVVKLKDAPLDTRIYISVLQHSKRIEEELRKKKFVHIINFTKSIKSIPDILHNISSTNYLWLVEDKSKMIHSENLDKVMHLLTDDKSKETLSKIINLRKTLDIEFYVDPEGTEYFPQDIPMLNNLEEINFIDCGAYIGDTIHELMNQSDKVKSTISFEPDAKNLTALNIELSALKNKYPKTNFLVYPAGVYSKNGILKFLNSGVDSGASLSDSSTLQVPVVSLDDTIINSSPNYIKMDIEGAEKEALLGAVQTIKKYKPNLAVCLYHKPQDLWELPLLINEIEPMYDMYLRVHEDMGLSTVLYCIARK